LTGDDLLAFKNYTANSGLVKIPKNTPSFLLWAKQGAVRHAKMFNTDSAWEPWFFGKDVCDVLKYDNSRDAITL